MAEQLVAFQKAQKTTLLLPQVQGALEAVARIENMCLPKIETLELYSFTDEVQLSADLGSPAHEQTVQGVCTEIGNLVAMGVLPSLRQVKPTSPCMRTGCWGRRVLFSSYSREKPNTASEDLRLDQWLVSLDLLSNPPSV